MKKWILAFAAFATLLMSLGCGGTSGGGSVGRFAYVLVNPTQLSAVNLFMGTVVDGPVTLTANIRDIAMRPSDGKLFGLGSDLKLYQINPSTGTCTVVSSSPMALDGYNGGMTFEPSSTTIRFMSSLNHNYTINSNTGAIVTTDTDTTNAVVGLAARDTTGVFFAYSTDDKIYTTSNASGGSLSLLGSSGVNLSGDLGLAIDNQTGKGYVVANEGLYRMDLSTGALTLLSNVGYDDIAVVP